MERLKQKSNEEDENSLTMKIKLAEKEIMASNSEIENYKKSIDNLKNKLEFKINLEKALNLENILKGEILKNKEIKKEFESLSKLNTVTARALLTYDRENRISDKMDILKSEIKLTKESLKEYQEKFSKQDKYLKGIHEKITNLESLTKKLIVPKVEIKKSFTKEDLKTLLDALERNKNQVKESKKVLMNSKKHNEEKLNSFINLNKKIEQDFKENDKMNKMLIFKKNELKRLIKTNNNQLESRVEKIENKNTKKIIQNGDISHLFPKKNDFTNQSLNYPNESSIVGKDGSQINLINLNLPVIERADDREEEKKETNAKLFSRNPNRETKEISHKADEESNFEESRENSISNNQEDHFTIKKEAEFNIVEGSETNDIQNT